MADSCACPPPQLARAAKTQTKHLGTVLEKYRKESKLRKKLHNEIMEMRGNIRVFARVRPVVPKEDQEGAVMVAKFPAEATISMVNSKRLQKEWEFDHVFRPEHTNADVFEQCRDLLTSVVDGYNVCIFAYGQVRGTPHRSPPTALLPIRTACTSLTCGCARRRAPARRIPWAGRLTTLASTSARSTCCSSSARSGRRCGTSTCVAV